MKKIILIVFFFFGVFTFLSIEKNPLIGAKPISNFYTTGKVPPANCSRQPASLRNSAREYNITIPQGEVAYITENIDADTITINGELHCHEAKAAQRIEISAKTIIVNGLLKCGSDSNRYNKKLIISLKHSSIDPVTNPNYRGLIVHGGGRLELFGEKQNSGWAKLTETMNSGDSSITLTPRFKASASYREQRNKDWQIGDQIVIGPTGFNYQEAESFKITGFDRNNPNKFYLNRAAKFRHWGNKKTYNSSVLGKVTLDERAEVANLTRSIVIQADEYDFPIDESDSAEAQRGGHVMVHHSSEAYIDGVEFYKMGQAGVLARYPFHWHFVGDATGQFIKNSSIHKSYQRCIVIHRTQNARVQNNVCYNFKGHGYFLEDGDEIGNKIISNLAVMARAPSNSKILLASDDINNSEAQGRFPSVSSFWISNPDNYIVSNVASGSVGTGFWMSFERQVFNSSGDVVASPVATNTDTFNYNKAHATKVGITWDGAPGSTFVGNPNNPNDRKLTSAHYRPSTVPTFRGLVAYKNYLSGIYFRGQTAIYDRALVAENGRSFWLAYNNIVKNSVFIGKTENQSDQMDEDFYNKTRSDRYKKGGITLYDGPFEIHNSDFFDFSTVTASYQLDSGAVVNSTVIPFVPTGGTSKFTNFVSGLRFSPEPIHRAHLENPSVTKERSYLGISKVRDMDGSLSATNINSLVVSKRSMGILSTSGCNDAGESLKNYMVCPSSYTESNLDFMRWGGSGHSPWRTPFILYRDDGASSYPISEWNAIRYNSNSTVALANSNSVKYKLLPRYQYTYDKNVLGAQARFEANSEVSDPQIPIVQVVAYGKNCRLEEGAVQVARLRDLKDQEVTSYYSSGESFFVKVIPDQSWRMFGASPEIQATANSTNIRFPIECDDVPITKVIKGAIDRVDYGRGSTTLHGWACNYSHSSSVQVKIYAHQNYYSKYRSSSKAPAPILLDTAYSNKDPDEEVSVNCGYMSGSGRRFRVTLSNSQLAGLGKYKFYVKGISNSGGSDRYLKGSGKYSIPQVHTDRKKTSRLSR